MENQIGQLANLIFGRQQGSPPGNTKLNLKEQVEVITLRSGKQLPKRERPAEEKVSENQEKESNAKPLQLVKEYKPTVPYPAKLEKDRMDE